MSENFNLDDLKKENLTEETSVETNTSVEVPVDPTQSEIKEVNIEDIAPYREEVPANQQYVDGLFADLDKALDKEHDKIVTLQEEYVEKHYQEQLEAMDDEEEGTSEDGSLSLSTDGQTESSNNIFEETDSADFFANLDFDEDEDDFDDDEEENDEEESRKDEEEQFNKLKQSVKQKIVPVGDKVDLSKFSINKKPVSISKLLSVAGPKVKTADWVLFSTKRPITVSEVSGPELEKINPMNSSRNRFNTYKDIYNIIYNHIVDANKPETLEAWVKTLKFFDTDHIYFALYKACFEGNNSVPYNCPECKEMFIVDTPIEDMVKYATPEVKEEVRKILEMDSTSTGEYKVDLMQISDNYVAAIKEPSVYEVVFETAALDENFTTKYSNLLGLISYIDDLYYIDRENEQLAPIGYKQYPNNIIKTTKNKIRTYYEVLSTLSSDQYYELSTNIAKIKNQGDQISYILPKVTCPKCGHVIPESVESADSLLFTRHQLGAIANI